MKKQTNENTNKTNEENKHKQIDKKQKDKKQKDIMQTQPLFEKKRRHEKRLKNLFFFIRTYH